MDRRQLSKPAPANGHGDGTRLIEAAIGLPRH
jgi:hypothetical protein